MGGEEVLVGSVGGVGSWVKVWEVDRHLGVTGRRVLGERIMWGGRWRRRARWCTVKSIVRFSDRCHWFGIFILPR